MIGGKIGPARKDDPHARAAVRAHNEAQTDWLARCPRCGAILQGTLASIREHKCEDPRG